ncbi:MAG: hypothetical protein P4L31_07630 [Candidatus Babeliales bacterium]|nr:hypothetical protein [Candidatus Babeliales bacterium]
MKHKWEKPTSEEIFPGCKGKKWICKVCGAVKHLANKRFAEPQYVRSHQIFDHYIECIDEAFEKTKTID